MGESILKFYKKVNIIFKIILLPLLLLGIILWCIGNLAQWRTLVMFLLGLIIGSILFYFFGHYLIDFINNIKEVITWK